jgi:hypothetical protein
MRYETEQNKLFKRDFVGKTLDQFPALKHRHYGFTYRQDFKSQQDDVTYFGKNKGSLDCAYFSG